MTPQDNWNRQRIGFGYQRSCRVPGPIEPMDYPRARVPWWIVALALAAVAWWVVVP